MPTDKRERRKQFRAERRRAEQRRASRRTLLRGLRRGALVAGVVLAVYLVGVYVSRRPESLPAAYLGFRGQPTACGASPPPPETITQYQAPEPQQLAPAALVTARLRTSCGEVAFRLDQGTAPRTVESFVFLAREGFYDGTVFHRVVDDFVVQGGDPNADGSGGPGYQLADELPPEGFVYERGVVALANRGRNTSGSQFFVVIGEGGAGLTRTFSVLGGVIEGMEMFDEMLGVDRVVGGDGARSKPLETIYLESVEITVEP